MPPKPVDDALAHLREISSQIEVAVIFGADGKVVAASGASGDRAEHVAKASLALLEEADRTGESGRRVAQLDASTQGGSLFVVREGDRLIAATTPTEPTVGLVFYDLKSCLRAAAAQPPAKPKAKAAAAKKPAAKRAPARKSPGGSRQSSRPSRKRDADS